MNLLIADSDLLTYDVLKLYLKDENFHFISAIDDRDVIETLTKNNKIDLAVIDVELPVIGGFELVKEIRENNLFLPIVLTSSTHQADYDKILGLESGADDYLVKPFNPLELIARIKSLLRRQFTYGSQFDQVKTKPGLTKIKQLVLNHKGRMVENNVGESIQLTKIEYKILNLLASELNQTYSFDEIVFNVWGESGASYSTFCAHMSNLRNKLASINEGDSLVQTVWGNGYKIPL